MKLALGVLAVYGVDAFRRLVVAFHPLGAKRNRAQRHFVCLEHLITTKQRHGASGFDDQNAVSLRLGRRPGKAVRGQQQNGVSPAVTHVPDSEFYAETARGPADSCPNLTETIFD